MQLGMSIPYPGDLRFASSDFMQISERFNFDRHSTTQLHNLTHPDNVKGPISGNFISMACFVKQAEVGHVGIPDGGWGSICVERSEAAIVGIPSCDTGVEAVRVRSRKYQMAGLVEERPGLAI